MMNRLSFLLATTSLFVSCVSCSADTIKQTPLIPLSVDHVETHRVGDYLVRIIQHNMELLPQIDLELLSTPQPLLVDSLSIKSITLDGRERIFSESAGVFIENIKIGKSSVIVRMDYYFSDEESSMVTCNVSIKDKLLLPSCSRE